VRFAAGAENDSVSTIVLTEPFGAACSECEVFEFNSA